MARVLITGAASGLGAALTRAFAARGDEVLATDLRGAEVDLDVRSEADWRRVRDVVLQRWSGLDILINNAGVAGGGRIERTDAAEWHRVLDVNVIGVANGCAAFAPVFQQQGSGHVVNVASLAGLVHPAGMSAYTASKAAVVAMSESLRHELRPWGVAVSVVCPSFFRTNLAESLTDDDPVMAALSAKLIERSPFEADDIAERVVGAVAAGVFLVLPDAEAMKAYWSKRLDPVGYDAQMLTAGQRIKAAGGSPRGS